MVFYCIFLIAVIHFYQTAQRVKSHELDSSHDVTNTRCANSPAGIAGCLRPVYFFHDNTVERFRGEEEPKFVPAGSTSLTMLNCYD